MAVSFINDGADTYLSADVGAGKTAIILTALSDKIKAGVCLRALIIGPKNVAETVWHAECLEWEHLRHLNIAPLVGGPSQRRALLQNKNVQIYTISYENIVWFIENYKDALPVDAIVFDEIDMMCNIGSQRFKKLRYQVKKFTTRIGCTATPLSTGELNLWAQMYLLDQGESLGTSYERFKQEYFYPTDFNEYNWEPRPGAQDYILDRIAFVTHAVDSSAHARKAPVEVDLYTTYDAKIMATYSALKRKLAVELPSGDTVEADSQAVAAGKLLQIAAGFSYVENEAGERSTIWHSKDKFDMLDSVLAKHPDEQVLVVYNFIAQAEVLSKRYPGIPIKFTPATIRKWNSGELRLAAAHPASMSHGINLQKAGARIIVYLTLPWTHRRYAQVNGRLNRQGNPNDEILVYRFIAGGTADEDAAQVIEHRSELQDTVLGAMREATKNAV